jgi:phosphonate transport system substrate-binding protein
MLRVLILFLTSASVYAAQETPLRLHFGVYPSDRATVMYRKFSPILEAITAPIENQLKRDVDIHLTIFEDYESGIKALAEGTVDFVRFGPSSYILAEQLNPNIQLLAMELRNGKKTFNGVLVATIASGVNAIQDVKGKRVAFGDIHSTIGRYLSQSLLVDNGVTANTLHSFDYLGRHDLVAKALITGTHDVGAMKSSTYKKLCDPDDIAIIATFENVTKPWIARAEMSKEIMDAITAALLLLTEPKEIGELGCSGFTLAKPKDYDSVRLSMQNASLFESKEETELESD